MRQVGYSLALFVVASALVGCSGESESEKKKPKGDPTPFEGGNEPAPPTEGKDSEGKSLKLSDYKGKVVLVDFWATWCGPCRKILPHEKMLVKAHQDKPFAVLGISADRNVEALNVFEKNESLNFRSIYDGPGGPIASVWGVQSLPTIFLVDHEGIVRYRFMGLDQIEGNLDAAIDLLLEKVKK